MPNLQVPHNLSTSAQYASDGTNDSALALATDKVGVGTASPVEQLHVASDSNHAILLSRANGSYGFRIHRGASAGVVRLQIRNEVPDWETKIQIGEGVTDESLLLNPDNEGKVGIGTVYPQERLDVNGSIAIRVENGNYRVGTMRKVFNVLDYGAVADGTTDCCAAFQCALDAAKSAGGGIVYVPRGVYKIGAYLEIGNNVILEGESIGIGCLSTVEISEMVDRKEGSILLAYDESRPFITLTEGRNAAVKGIAVFYPDQAISGTLEDPSYLKEYPFCIRSYTANPSIINVTLVNPYRGIFITNAGRYLIDGVWGQPLLQGLEIQACVASSRIRKCAVRTCVE